MSQALYRKWRPQKWDEVVGQEHIIQTLKNAITSDRVGHAYLLSGPRGTGKTTTARLLAKAVNCLSDDLAKRPCDQCDHCKAVNEGRFLDLIEIDAASNTSVDDMRDLRDKINFSPSQGRYKVYIIDEVHMLSMAAFNALLKTLEEPPSHAIFILATTEAHKIPATVLSRCQRHEFRRIEVKKIYDHLKKLAEDEKITVEPDALTLIARQSTGCMRDAISLLDQLASSGENITLPFAQNVLGTATNQAVISLVDAILAGDNGSGLNRIHQTLDGGTDPRQFARQVVDYLRYLLMFQMGDTEQVDATEDLKNVMKSQAGKFLLPHLLQTLRLFNSAASDNRTSWQPNLPLELALAEAIQNLADAQTMPGSSSPVSSTVTDKPVLKENVNPSAEKAQPSGISNVAAGKPFEQSIKPAVPQQANVQIAQPSAGLKQTADQNNIPTEADLQGIKQNWPRIRVLVKKMSPQTEGLLNSCKSMDMKGSALVLSFASEVVRSKMDTTDHLERTRQAIEQVTGLNVTLRCIVTNGKINTVNTDLDVEGDGMVSAALNLGGQIVHKE